MVYLSCYARFCACKAKVRRRDGEVSTEESEQASRMDVLPVNACWALK